MVQIQIIGNIGADARITEVNANKIINFSVASNEKYKDQEGQTIEKTNWFNCGIFRKDGNLKIADYLTKGTKVFIQGKPTVKLWKDNNGITQASISVMVDRVELLSSTDKPAENQQKAQNQAANTADQYAELPEDFNSDLSF